MQAKKPIIGLIMFMFHSASGNLSIALMACSISGIVFLVTGNSAVHTFFISLTIAMPPYTIITSIASDYASKWERFRIAMPVRREDVTSSQYLCIIIASIVGIPFIGIIMGISVALHESLSEIVDKVVSSTVSTFSIAFGIALLLGALFFPLTCMKIGENKGEALAFVCVLAALGIICLVSWAGYSMNLSQYTISLLRVAISVIPFIFSYLFTKNLYAKLDL